MRAASLTATILIVYALGLLAIEHRIHASGAPSLESAIPLVTIGKPFFELGRMTQALCGLCAVLETLVIYALATLEPTAAKTLRVAVPLAALAMLLISLGTDFTNSDVYYYVYYGKSASLASAYTESARLPELPPAFQGLRHVLTAPVVASVYGPVWVALDRAIVAPAHSLDQAVHAVRIASAIALAFTIVLVSTLRLPAPLTAAIALNPALYYSYVVQAHNDIYAILATVAGLVVLRRKSPVLAAGFGALAGASKLSVVLVALAALTPVPPVRVRAAIAVGILIGAAVLLWLIGGPEHVRTMVSVGHTMAGKETSARAHALRLAVQVLAIGCMLIVIIAAIGFRRRFAAASLVFPAASGLVQPWYFPWGLAYALGDARAAIVFCTALPVLVFATDAGLTDAFPLHLTPLIVAAIVLALVRGIALLRPRQSRTKAGCIFARGPTAR